MAFNSVRALLKYNGASSLDPYYPPRWVDVVGARLTLEYGDGWTYSVYAPDEHTWPAKLHELNGAFAQLVRDTAWQK